MANNTQTDSALPVQHQDIPTDVTKTMRYLWHIANTYAESSPEISRFFISRMNDVALTNDIPIGISMTHIYCNYCFNFLISGKNCAVRIKSHTELSKTRQNKFVQRDLDPLSNSVMKQSKNLREARKKLKNFVSVHCHVCDHVTLFAGISSEQQQLVSTPVTTPSSSSNSKTHRAVSTPSTPKKRRQKNKRDSLKDILKAEKKPKTEDPLLAFHSVLKPI